MIKIELIKQGDFNLLDLFKQFDSQDLDPNDIKGVLTKQNIESGLKDFYEVGEEHVTSSMLSLMFSFFSGPSEFDRRIMDEHPA